MTLRRKLLLVALSTLVLPVAGWLYLRQMEHVLRAGQADALQATARAVARALEVEGVPLPPAGPAWYVETATTPIAIDGYLDDWAPLAPWVQKPAPGLRVQLARDGAALDIAIAVREGTRTRADAGDADALHADHLLLTFVRGAAQRRFLVASAAPGRISGLALDPPVAGLPDQLRGAWQDDGSGYSVELTLARSEAPQALAIAAYDAGTPQRFPPAPEARPLIGSEPALTQALAALIPRGVRASVVSARGWRVARAGTPAPVIESSLAETLLAALDRAWIAPPLEPAGHDADAPRLAAADVWQALSGVTASAWHAGPTPGSLELRAAVPLVRRGETRGALLLEQTYPLLPPRTDRALLTLLLASFAALLIAAGALFAFAARLSWRLGRLRDAAEGALRPGGLDLTGAFPLSDASDELGDLARSFERLLGAVGGYADYLRTLPSRLSHELHTPLAIVRSSLDNLEHAQLPAAAQPYLARARDGAARLGAIVRAMSEASRIERAVAAAEPEDFDLAQVVRGCAEAHAELAAPRRLELDLPAEPLPLHGAPELIAQALDKLLDNARSFTPANGWIRVRLRALPDAAAIEVANAGPALPQAMQGRLFEALVSVRAGARPDEAPHLGLGLTIVRLVAALHGGEATAHNLDDGDGVVFGLTLRGMPRRALGAGVTD
ncbi:MAG: histidine kinase [Xanthomonadaceae bacterium]|nr:histidine kinase [Xanthomonadaceae bacterium]MDE1958528.1 histidine kinase [Xanthomonadaceae bacterium]